jgi:hypothetical protein
MSVAYGRYDSYQCKSGTYVKSMDVLVIQELCLEYPESTDGLELGSIHRFY